MKLDAYIKSMPKIELGLRFEGAVRKKILLTIAEQNDIPDTIKRFSDWVRLLEKPDPKRIEEIVRMVTTWWRYAEDFSRMAYDIGVMLANENVKYAEVLINPTVLLQQGQLPLSIDELIEALNDGRDRAYRGWGVQMGWILVAPRDEPRKFEDIVRWATSNATRRNSIVAVGLVGKEEIVAPNPFERTIALAVKKDLPIVIQAGHQLKAEGILHALKDYSPSRILDATGLADAPDAISQILEREIGIVCSIGRIVNTDWSKKYADYPLADLLQHGIKPAISADMPTYHTTLIDEYLAIVEQMKLPIETLEDLSLHAVANSFLSPSDKSDLIEQFASTYAHLKSDDVVAE
ncbi:MAG: hypothetical protein CUN52_03140 [Phototrophicales bacterium]|nr:MAG: hypothetical protein CUN52_03140 [Phototrophicales bacterium]